MRIGKLIIVAVAVLVPLAFAEDAPKPTRSPEDELAPHESPKAAPVAISRKADEAFFKKQLVDLETKASDDAPVRREVTPKERAVLELERQKIRMKGLIAKAEKSVDALKALKYGDWARTKDQRYAVNYLNELQKQAWDLDDELQIAKEQPLNMRIIDMCSGGSGYTSKTYTADTYDLAITWDGPPDAIFVLRFVDIGGDVIARKSTNKGIVRVKNKSFHIEIIGGGSWSFAVARLGKDD